MQIMRRTFLSAIAISVAGHGALAQVATYCTNCSTTWQQITQLANQVKQYALQGQQYAAQAATLNANLRQYQNMVQNTIQLPQSVWSNVQNDIMQVRNLANAGSLLAGNSGTILNRLQNAGYYANAATALPGNMSGQLTMWQQSLQNSSRSLATTLGVQQGQENSYTALQAQLQLHSQTAVGQMQAIQAGNEIAALTNTQLQQIQTTLVAAAQNQANHELVADDRRALSDAAKQQFLQSNQMPMTGVQY